MADVRIRVWRKPGVVMNLAFQLVILLPHPANEMALECLLVDFASIKFITYIDFVADSNYYRDVFNLQGSVSAMFCNVLM